MLKVENLKKYFGGVKAVDDCSFEVKEKTITALIGPNGSGKTTVFNLISGILKADSGKIIFNEKPRTRASPAPERSSVLDCPEPNFVLVRGSVRGRDITNLSIEEISNLGISRLFQQTRLFNNLTVKENLLLALDNEDTKFWKNLLGLNKITEDKIGKIREILKLVNLEKFENVLVRELSYGQKRLVELSRALLNPHSFLMLDEPVAGVNPKLRNVIADILLKLKQQGETILLIEHDMNFAFGVADEVIVVDEGKVIAKGAPKEIKENPRVLEAYLGE